ncbi:WD repeat domain 74 lethal (2) k09848 isoform X2 [Oratosquilla oratoria]|uniref:WD repeat domain 74 lethal (2) k09848 isoform X2 n=1 Tax=Oratosquilla oratoria TaxID=337810 RepID=UPI003F76F265
MEENCDFNVFVGAETGVLKGININRKAVVQKNFHKLKGLFRENEITAMCWGDSEEIELLMGLRDQTVRTFDTSCNAFVSSWEAKVREGQLVSLARIDGITVTAVKSGQVTLWKSDTPVEINALQKGEFLTCMRQSPHSRNHLATGGKGNDLQLWDLNRHDTPIFRAKNVKPDMLQLEQPIWVSDIAFMSDEKRMAVATRHKQVRLYDPACQRRPVISVEWEDSPFTTISTAPHIEHQVLVGTAHGRMAQFDLRTGHCSTPVCVYKGFAGAVKDLVVHPTLPVVFTASLDRHLRIHHLHTRKLLQKEYLKSRLNCLLVRSNVDLEQITPKPKKFKYKRKVEYVDDQNSDEGYAEENRNVKQRKQNVDLEDSD